MKGRKTHAQTIYAMDTATGSARADCDVCCAVARGGQSRRRASNNTVPDHHTSRPCIRLFLAPLIKENV